MIRERRQYRINKKGAQFRLFDNYETAQEALKSLSAQRPGIYTLQYRTCRVNRYGVCDRTPSGNDLWSPWVDW